MSLKDALKSRRAVQVYLVLSGLFILFMLADAFILPWIVHSRSEIAIPNVVNKKFSEAQQILIDHGLNPVKAGTMPSEGIRPGCVAFQNPIAHSVVREGRNVYLTVSGGEEQVLLPNLRGRSLRDAKITLEQLDLRLGLVSYIASDLPEETVVGQAVPPGQRVVKMTAIPVSVSSGAGTTQLDVPNIVGMSLEEAQQTLVAQRLKLGNIAYRQSGNLVPNTVISQSPGPNDKVDINTPIDVTIVH
jgi:eukaryotic-like serine/threonine-protein kinase